MNVRPSVRLEPGRYPAAAEPLRAEALVPDVPELAQLDAPAGDPAPPPPQAPARPATWAERDRALTQLIHRASASPALVRLLAAASRLSDGLVWYATALALPWLGGATGTACALRMVMLGVLDLCVYKIMKRHFARPRPYVDCPGVRACTKALDEHSFPSGHTLHAVGFGTMLTVYYPGLGWLVWPFVALVAASRVVLGLHYPSDVVVGALIGWFMATSVLVLF
jgi:undecaprenyl-diphosphatase